MEFPSAVLRSCCRRTAAEEATQKARTAETCTQARHPPGLDGCITERRNLDLAPVRDGRSRPFLKQHQQPRRFTSFASQTPRRMPRHRLFTKIPLQTLLQRRRQIEATVNA